MRHFRPHAERQKGGTERQRPHSEMGSHLSSVIASIALGQRRTDGAGSRGSTQDWFVLPQAGRRVAADGGAPIVFPCSTCTGAEGTVPTFKAIVVEKGDGGQKVGLTDFEEANLMGGDVTVRVEWSTVNYKDGLAVTGKAPVVRRFPMIAGIDFAGTVKSSSHPRLESRRQGHS